MDRLKLINVALFSAWFFLPCSCFSFDEEWKLLQEIEIDAYSKVVFILREYGNDYAIKAESEGAETIIIDGANQFIGFEALALENKQPHPAIYKIYTASRIHRGISSHSVTSDSNPSENKFSNTKNYQKAHEFWYKSEYNAAITLWETIADQRSNELAAFAKLELAEAYYQLQRYEDSFSHINDLIEAQNSDLAISSDFLNWRLALNLTALNLAEEAELKYTGLLNKTLSAKDPADLILRESIRASYGHFKILNGFYANNRDNLEQGSALVEAAVSNAEHLKDPAALGTFYAFLGNKEGFLSVLNQADKTEHLIKAIGYYKHARALLTTAGKLPVMMDVLNNLAFAHQRLGDIGYSQQLFSEAYRQAQSLPYVDPISIRQVAKSYKLNGDYYRARHYLRDSIDQFHRNRGPGSYQPAEDPLKNNINRQQSDFYLELGEIHRLNRDITSAISVHSEILALADKNKWSEERFESHMQLADDYLSLGDHQHAKAHINWLESTISNPEFYSSNSTFFFDASLVIGRFYLGINQPNTAKAVLLKSFCSLAVCRGETPYMNDTKESKVIERDLQIEHAYYLAKISEIQAEDTQVSQYAEYAFDLISSVREQLGPERQGSTWVARMDKVTNWYVGYLLSRHSANRGDYAAQAFEKLQQTRAINLRDNRKILKALNVAEEIYAGAGNVEKRKVLTASLAGLNTEGLELEALKKEILGKSDIIEQNLNEIDIESNNLTLSGMQQNIGRIDAQAISYVLEEEGGYAVHITKKFVNVVAIPPAEELIKLLNNSIGEIQAKDSISESVALRKLSEALLGGLSLNKDSKAILLEVPAIMQRIPFATLLDIEDLKNQDTPKFLNENYSVYLTPSFSAYFEQLETDTGAGNFSISIIADPDFDVINLSELEDFSSLTYKDSAIELQPLNFSQTEVSNIIKNFPDKDAAVFTRQHATIEALLSDEVRQSKILHISSHGFSDASNPLLTGLLLSSNDGSISSHFLTVNDIQSSSFDADLVVINACESATGEALGNEGMMGLSQAFLKQGAKATIGTLWPVSDRASAEFMAYFYQALRDPNTDLALALQKAQHDMRENPRYRHPYYWAPFVLTVADRSAAPVPHYFPQH